MSYNCKGIQQKHKRLRIFNYIHDKNNIGFTFLQETHSTPDCESVWKKEWGGHIYFSHGCSNSTGAAICISKNLNYNLVKVSSDTSGRILILEIVFNGQKYLLINLYNNNDESTQLLTLDILENLLDGHDIDGDCFPIFGGDFNMIHDVLLDASGGTPSLKKRSLAKIIHVTDKLDVCDIFRVRFPNSKRFTFRQKTPLRQRRLDYIFVSNNIQEYVTNIDILPSFLSDHSPVLVKIDTLSNMRRGNYAWKFNSSLLSDPLFIATQTDNIISTINSFDHNFDPHIKWELLKYEMRKSCISFAKNKNRANNILKNHHENICKKYESTDDKPDETTYVASKLFLDNLIDHRTHAAMLRSKCQWHEHGEKSSKFFLNLEKKNSVNNTIKKLLIDNNSDGTEIVDPNSILDNLHGFYSNLFQRKSTKTLAECDNFLENIDVPKISAQQKLSCEQDISIDELKDSLFSMHKKKTPGNDGLSSEFYIEFWDLLKGTFFDSVKYSFQVGFLSTSQRQAIIKLIEKKDKDKRFISNWRPISLLNVDTKIVSKCLAFRLVPVLPSIISSDQTAYVKNRFIGESIRLISDILELSNSKNLDGFILTADLEKAFDSIDHTFLMSCLKKFGFGPKFLQWVEILLSKNESCVMNGGTTTKYFALDRGARQGDPIAAYFFIIVLEIFFIMIRSNNNINHMKILDFSYVLTAYADDTTFFVADSNSIVEIYNTFSIFSNFSGLKLNNAKCEICGIGAKKGDKTALCGFRNVDLTTDSIKVLGVHFSYNDAICLQNNFIAVVKKIEKVLQVWNMRPLTLSGKIIIFKSLAISKIVYISYLSNVPNAILDLLENIHKKFIWNNKRPKIKHSALINDYCDGGLKDIDIRSKIKALQLSWLKRLYDSNDHPWKLIPMYYFSKLSSCSSSIFYPNFDVDIVALNILPAFYKNLATYWLHFSHAEPIVPSSVLSESIWNNRFIKIDSKPIKPSLFGVSCHIFVKDLLDENGNFTSWYNFSSNFNIDRNRIFQWFQLRSSIPNKWLRLVRNNTPPNIICELKPHINIMRRMCSVDKLDSASIYNLLLKDISKPPTSQSFFNTKFDISHLWKTIYLLPRNTTIDSYTRVFQYKILNNILFLNNKLYHLNLVDTPLCSLCGIANESAEHLFYECTVTQDLWKSLQFRLNSHLSLKDLTLQSAVFGFLDEPEDVINTTNHILLIFKTFLYKYRNRNTSPTFLFACIKNVATIEGLLCTSDNHRQRHNLKWGNILNLL